jgi:hypothetical protein
MAWAWLGGAIGPAANTMTSLIGWFTGKKRKEKRLRLLICVAEGEAVANLIRTAGSAVEICHAMADGLKWTTDAKSLVATDAPSSTNRVNTILGLRHSPNEFENLNRQVDELLILLRALVKADRT